MTTVKLKFGGYVLLKLVYYKDFRKSDEELRAEYSAYKVTVIYTTTKYASRIFIENY